MPQRQYSEYLPRQFLEDRIVAFELFTVKDICFLKRIYNLLIEKIIINVTYKLTYLSVIFVLLPRSTILDRTPEFLWYLTICFMKQFSIRYR